MALMSKGQPLRELAPALLEYQPEPSIPTNHLERPLPTTTLRILKPEANVSKSNRYVQRNSSGVLPRKTPVSRVRKTAPKPKKVEPWHKGFSLVLGKDMGVLADSKNVDSLQARVHQLDSLQAKINVSVPHVNNHSETTLQPANSTRSLQVSTIPTLDNSNELQTYPHANQRSMDLPQTMPDHAHQDEPRGVVKPDTSDETMKSWNNDPTLYLRDLIPTLGDLDQTLSIPSPPCWPHPSKSESEFDSTPEHVFSSPSEPISDLVSTPVDLLEAEKKDYNVYFDSLMKEMETIDRCGVLSKHTIDNRAYHIPDFTLPEDVPSSTKKNADYGETYDPTLAEDFRMTDEWLEEFSAGSVEEPGSSLDLKPLREDVEGHSRPPSYVLPDTLNPARRKRASPGFQAFGSKGVSPTVNCAVQSYSPPEYDNNRIRLSLSRRASASVFVPLPARLPINYENITGNAGKIKSVESGPLTPPQQDIVAQSKRKRGRPVKIVQENKEVEMRRRLYEVSGYATTEGRMRQQTDLSCLEEPLQRASRDRQYYATERADERHEEITEKQIVTAEETAMTDSITDPQSLMGSVKMVSIQNALRKGKSASPPFKPIPIDTYTSPEERDMVQQQNSDQSSQALKEGLHQTSKEGLYPHSPLQPASESPYEGISSSDESPSPSSSTGLDLRRFRTMGAIADKMNRSTSATNTEAFRPTTISEFVHLNEDNFTEGLGTVSYFPGMEILQEADRKPTRRIQFSADNDNFSYLPASDVSPVKFQVSDLTEVENATPPISQYPQQLTSGFREQVHDIPMVRRENHDSELVMDNYDPTIEDITEDVKHNTKPIASPEENTHVNEDVNTGDLETQSALTTDDLLLPSVQNMVRQSSTLQSGKPQIPGAQQYDSCRMSRLSSTQPSFISRLQDRIKLGWKTIKTKIGDGIEKLRGGG